MLKIYVFFKSVFSLIPYNRAVQKLRQKLTVSQIIGIIATALCIGVFVHEPSFPTPDKLLVFGTSVSLIFRQALEMLKRFVPFVGLLLIYESFRGIATHLNNHVHYTWMADVDKHLFFGHLPTVWLQQHLWHGNVQWFDFVLYITYMMHFVLPFALAIVVWKLRDKHYWHYVMSYVTVSFAGFLTFLAFPAAPPWMASDKGYIEHITRVSSSVWAHLGIHDFPSVYNKLVPNPVAAVPSLHAAYATLFAIFAFKLFKNTKWKYMSLFYPAFIYFGTVYQGEHYAIDEILGALYAVGAYFAAPYVIKGIVKVWSPIGNSSQYKAVVKRLHHLHQPKAH